MSPDATTRHERVSRVEDSHWWFVALREMVVATLARELPRGGTVLDAGCGTGAVLAALPDRYEPSGIDVSEGALEIARERLPGAELLSAGVEEIPFADAVFDAVLSLDVLPNSGVSDDRAAVREMRRVLKPGGGLIVQVPAYQWLLSGHDTAAGQDRRYTARGLRALLVESRLEPVRITYRVATLLAPAAARRLLTRGSERSDVQRVAPTLNAVLGSICRAEDDLARRVSLPFGLSVFGVARA